MPFDPFHVDLAGVLGLSRVHADAAETLTGAKESALAKAAGVDATHGSIGTRVTGAFSEVLDARHGALQAAAHTSNELSQRLAKAITAYTRGDESGAESVRAAAEAMTGGASGSAGTPIASSSHIGAGAIGAAESGGAGAALGQAVGQAGQHAGGPEHAAGVGASAVDPDLASRSPADEQEQIDPRTRD